MKTLRFFLLLALPALFSACDEDDVIASFMLSNTSPGTGEVITVSNVTVNAETYEWTVDDVFYSSDPYPAFQFNTSGATHRIRLTVTGKGRNNRSMSSREVTVVPKGKVTFWQNTALYSAQVGVMVVMYGSDTITAPETSAPACDDTNCATFFLPPGTHPWTATQVWPATQTWSGNVTVTDGGCAVVEVQ